MATTALYIDENAVPFVVRDRIVSEPTKGEVQVEVIYSGVSAADVKHATDLGIHPTVMGYDFMGKVLKAGPDSEFAPGDLVAGYTVVNANRSDRYGTHQQYLANPEDLTWHVPPAVPKHHAAALTVAVATAADALINNIGFFYPGHRHPNPGFRYGPLLIWGASTSVGIAALQIARACGATPIFVAASAKHHEMLRKYGADQCFDHTDPEVVSKIKTAIQNTPTGELCYAMDSVGFPEAARKVKEVASRFTKLVSVVHQVEEGFHMAYAFRARMMTVLFNPESRVRFTMAAQPPMHANIRRVIDWAIENYGSEFELPSVDIFEGTAEEALEQVKFVGKCARFGKLVLKHPLL
ncbi:zinc-binding oxidoreductase-like protein ToxD [Xylariales sp. PMI_506]|nr:zinc-binding oxidoreductase-like protein ToxD [Xylariales sp. PMI_506]